MNTITFDPKFVPFTLPGSFLRVRFMPNGRLQISACRTLLERQARDGRWLHDFYELALFAGDTELPIQATGSPEQLTLRSADGSAEGCIAYSDAHTLRLSVTGASLRLIAGHEFKYIRRCGPQELFVQDSPSLHMHRLRCGAGTTVNVTGDAQQTATLELRAAGRLEADLQFTRDDRRFASPDWLTTESIIAARCAAASAWLAKRPAAPPEFEAIATKGWMRLANLIVGPEGPLTRPTLYMSKMNMARVWSWDNCLNALALAHGDPELAFDQLRVFYDHQSPTGNYPDTLDNLAVRFGHAKPAVWGWAICRMINQLGFERCAEFARESYAPLEAQIRYWTEERAAGGVPTYNHGCDSGWDNSTAFDGEDAVTTADLGAHLVLSCEALATLARHLGKNTEAGHWNNEAARWLKFWEDHNTLNGNVVSYIRGRKVTTTSMLDRMAVELGPRLPAALRESLVRELSPGGPYHVGSGWSSEPISSPKYEEDGYWRGSIWPSTSLIISDGLSRLGQSALVRSTAVNFLRMIDADGGILWENYNAKTGKGIRSPDYAWSAVGAVLFSEYLASGREHF